MTQPEATPPPQPPQRPQKTSRKLSHRPKVGVEVCLTGSPQVGTVVASDDWWDTLKLRGVGALQQALVEWPNEAGTPIRRWELVSQLEVTTDAPASEVEDDEDEEPAK